jgi:hypothetical protein
LACPYWFIIAPTSSTFNPVAKEATYIGENVYIRPNMIVSVPEFVKDHTKRSVRQKMNQLNLQNNDHKGKVSKKAEAKIKQAVGWLVESAKWKRIYSKKDKKTFLFKINFITLTLPDTEEEVTEKFFKTELMHAWLSYAQKYFYLKNYIWKIERQKNGKLHLHLTSDTFINHQKLRRSWNNLLKKKGLLTAFKKKFGHENPNSTDVHATKNIKNIGAYLAKYFTKGSNHTENIKGKIWGCNHALSDKNKCSVFIDRDDLSKEMRWIENKNIMNKQVLGKQGTFDTPYTIAQLYFLKPQEFNTIVKGKINQAYQDHKFYISNNIYNPPPEYYVY